MTYTAKFNDNDLAALVPGLKVIGSSTYRFPSLEQNIESVASADLSVNAGTYSKLKKINVMMEIGRDDRDGFDESLDILNSILQGDNKDLVLTVSGELRRWTATRTNIGVADVLGGHGQLEIEFSCTDPFGYSLTDVLLFDSAHSGSTATMNFVNPVVGSAEFQVPVITLAFDTAPGSFGTFSLDNPNTGQTLTVSSIISSSDEFVIDCRTKTVKRNGSDVRVLDGAFPEWKRGEAGVLDYSDTLASRIVSLEGYYNPRYV